MASSTANAVASTHGLVFSISPCKKAPKKKDPNEDNEEYILTLAPFTKPPKINFGQVKLNETVERNLLIINPQQFQLELNVTNTELNIDNIRLTLEKGQNINLKIKWQPVKPDNYKYSILFEVLNSARLKFLVHAFGVCIKPEVKKTTIRKPLTMLQPIKKEKTSTFFENLDKNPGIASKENKMSLEVTSVQTTMKKSATFTKTKSAIDYNDFYKEDFEDFKTSIEEPEPSFIDRRQTCVLKTPKLATFTEKSNTPIRKTTSYNDMNSTQLYSNMPATPKFEDFIKASITTTTTTTTTFASCTIQTNKSSISKDYLYKDLTFSDEDSFNLDETINKEDSGKVEKYAIICQKAWRMKKFRLGLKELKLKIKNEKLNSLIASSRFLAEEFELLNKKQEEILYEQELEKQRNQMKLLELERIEQEKRQKYLSCVLICQRAFRMKKFRRCLFSLKQHKCAIVCQKAFRMKLFRKSLNKLKHEKFLNDKASLIQKKWRLFKFRSKMFEYKTAALKIQTWFRTFFRQRKDYLILKNATLIIQKNFRLKKIMRNKAALVLQSNFRCFIQRKKYLKVKTSASLIQNWFRTKHDRIRYLKLKRSLPLIQLKAKKLALLQIVSARKIQNFYRMYKFRASMSKYRTAALTIQTWTRSMRPRYEFLQTLRLIISSTIKIQAIWRGYSVRKQTNQVLKTIRKRLSISSSNCTLGSRIKTSLEILKYPCVAIQQIIMALIDLDKVTRLSPECCLIFAKEGATEILYNFILNCNRSVPHMDLIKFCLQVFINLAKYTQTVQCILEPTGSLSILLNLLQAYQIANPSIFMDVCILFILLAQNEHLKSRLVNQESFIKKLTTINSTLKNRASIKQKQQTLILNLLPDWVISKKCIDFTEPIYALEHLVNLLQIKSETSAEPKTPKKTILAKPVGKKTPLASKLPISAKVNQIKKSKEIQVKSKVTITTKINKINVQKVELSNDLEESHISIFNSNMSYLSMHSNMTLNEIQNELPKLNSTTIFSATSSNKINCQAIKKS